MPSQSEEWTNMLGNERSRWMSLAVFPDHTLLRRIVERADVTVTAECDLAFLWSALACALTGDTELEEDAAAQFEIALGELSSRLAGTAREAESVLQERGVQRLLESRYDVLEGGDQVNWALITVGQAGVRAIHGCYTPEVGPAVEVLVTAAGECEVRLVAACPSVAKFAER